MTGAGVGAWGVFAVRSGRVPVHEEPEYEDLVPDLGALPMGPLPYKP